LLKEEGSIEQRRRAVMSTLIIIVLISGAQVGQNVSTVPHSSIQTIEFSSRTACESAAKVVAVEKGYQGGANYTIIAKCVNK
jgi:hypothetical protein